MRLFRVARLFFCWYAFRRLKSQILFPVVSDRLDALRQYGLKAGPRYIQVTVVVKRDILHAEHTLHVLILLPGRVQVLFPLGMGSSLPFIIGSQFIETPQPHNRKRFV